MSKSTLTPIEAQKIRDYITKLGYYLPNSQEVSVDDVLNARVADFTQKSIDTFIKEQLQNGRLKPEIVQNDLLLLEEMAKNFRILNENLFRPSGEIKNGGANAWIRKIFKELEPKILVVKSNFKSAETLQQHLGSLYRDVLMERAKVTPEDVDTLNFTFALAQSKNTKINVPFLLTLQDLLTQHAKLFVDDIARYTSKTVSFTVKEVLPEANMIIVHVTEGVRTHRIAISSVGVFSLTSGYYRLKTSVGGTHKACVQVNWGVDYPICRNLWEYIFKAERGKVHEIFTRPLEEKDIKRLKRIGKYAMEVPIAPPNRTVGVQTDQQQLVLSYKGIKLLASPLYLVDLTRSRILFIRSSYERTPMQNVQEQLPKALQDAPLPNELKSYLMDMYLTTTNLRAKI